MPGSFMAGPLGELIGPKRALMIALPLNAVCWIFQSFTTSLTVLYIARILMGIFYAIIAVLAQPLVAEMCEPEIRGLGNVLPEISASAGVLSAFLYAHFLPWRIAMFMNAVPVIILSICMFFIPEVTKLFFNFEALIIKLF